uniref:LSDAT_euk domain-containing protein n=2 Tax=Panagrellus redivivus TaxID=6233 RepID=A0A7E4V2Z3_PANRE
MPPPSYSSQSNRLFRSKAASHGATKTKLCTFRYPDTNLLSNGSSPSVSAWNPQTMEFRRGTERDSDVEPDSQPQTTHHSRQGNRHRREGRQKRRRKGSAGRAVSRKIRRSLGSATAPPRHVHGGDWREMLTMTQHPGLAHINRNRSDEDLASGADSRPKRSDKKKLSNSTESLPQDGGPANSEFSASRFHRAPSSSSTDQADWIVDTFECVDCDEFIPSSKDVDKCGCGRWRNQHRPQALQVHNDANMYHRREKRWHISKHTIRNPTDAFGTIEFQGGPHPHKAQYLRLGFDADPSNIMELFEKVWQIPPPKLIITVHGGISNFDLQQKLSRVFRKGLLKAARTTGAWIITSGINVGVVPHVAAALESGMTSTQKSKVRITCIGIAPWGLLKKREDFVGEDKVLSYHPHSFSPKGRFAVLNNRHSYYLLVDNGTVGRYGADIILRRRLEGYIVRKQKIDGGDRSVPVVCVLLEGGACTIRTVLDYVTNYPRVPVVICDGSGRASDLLAFAHQYINDEGTLPEAIRPQLLSLIKAVFGYDHENAQCLLLDIIACVRQKKLITVFRLGENQKQDVDYAILTALLKGHNLKPPEQLALALAWNRVDIARSDVFVMGQDWPSGALHDAMLEALIHNRVDFVRLLLENGVSMHKFLTIERLEQLYNTEHGPPNTLFYIVRDVVKMHTNYRYTLPHIGLAIEKLMGNGYRCYYASSEFRTVYNDYRKRCLTRMNQTTASRTAHIIPTDYLSGPLVAIAGGFSNIMEPPESSAISTAPSGSRALSNHLLWRSAYRRDNFLTPAALATPGAGLAMDSKIDIEDDAMSEHRDANEHVFQYPFSDLLTWAVLTKRHDMALCMWEHGEEAMAKALIACRLYKSLAKEAAEDYLEVEICEELKKYADEFRNLSLELLDCCYKHDDAHTLQLLTYELLYWGHETCLSLAVIVNNKAFLAHPCCQILLADLWHGGLRIRSNSNFKVIVGLLCPPTIFFLEFKSREELMQQPQTAAEHEDDINDTLSTSSESDASSSSSSSDSDDGDGDDLRADGTGQNAGRVGAAGRRVSTGSANSGNFPHIFQNKKRNRQSVETDKPIQMKAMNSTATNNQLAPNNGTAGAPNGRPPALSFSSNHAAAEPASTNRRRNRAHSWRTKGHSTSIDSTHSKRPNVDEKKAELPRKHSLLASIQRKWTRTGSDEKPSKSIFKQTLLPERIGGKRQIRIRRKIYEFFVAPVTTFWSWCLSYLIFLSVLTYVLLIKTPVNPTVAEWLLVSYVIAFCVELIRKLFMSEPQRFREKVGYFFMNYWNTFTALAVVSYLIGFGYRCIHDDTAYGRCILATSAVLWSIKLLDFLSVHPKFGPLVTMAGKMVLSMAYVVVMLCVSMLAFGLARQSITFPNEEWHWILLRNLFYKPYFMLYGEVYADEIDLCGDQIWDGHLEAGVSLSEAANGSMNACVPGHWIPPLLMTVFLLISNLLLISMLIAIFNHIFEATDKISQQIWLFQRYRQVMEYESTPFVPPPFTLIYHFYMLVKYLRHRILVCRGHRPEKRKSLFDFSLKLFLSNDQVEKLHDFEEECMEDYAREKEYEKNRSNEERLHRTAERTDLILLRINDLVTKEGHVKANVNSLENRIEQMEERQNEILDCLRQITTALPTILNSIQPRSTTPIPETVSMPVTSQMYVQQSRVSLVSEAGPSSTVSLVRAGSAAGSQCTVVDAGMLSGGEFLSGDGLDPPTYRRTRTATVSGNEIPSSSTASAPQGKLFGSILSLDKSMFPSSSTPSSSAKQNSVRRRRHHDEYTSITDTIDIEGITVGFVAPSNPVIMDDSETEVIGGRRIVRSSGSGIRTEEEDDDDEEEEEEELEFNFSPVDSSNILDSEYEFNGGPAIEVDTPTTTLKRAKASFVKRHNTFMKEYEDSVLPLRDPSESDSHADDDRSGSVSPSGTVRDRSSTLVAEEQAKEDEPPITFSVAKSRPGDIDTTNAAPEDRLTTPEGSPTKTHLLRDDPKNK